MKLGKWIEDNNCQDWSFGLRFAIYAMNNSICRAYNKKPYELVFGGTSHGHSAALDYLFETSIFFEDEISGLENIQESVDDLNDLIDNTIPITATESSSLNQDSNIETQSNLVNDNHENQDA
ncbi:8414_t:CDS:1, partial [Gigaspora margarita]